MFRFSEKHKNDYFSVILPGTRSVVNVGHFWVARTVPPSFVDRGPKLRVLIIAKWEWPEMAKNQGEPQKMTHYSETDFLSGWSESESCSPEYTMYIIYMLYIYI